MRYRYVKNKYKQIAIKPYIISNKYENYKLVVLIASAVVGLFLLIIASF